MENLLCSLDYISYLSCTNYMLLDKPCNFKSDVPRSCVFTFIFIRIFIRYFVYLKLKNTDGAPSLRYDTYDGRQFLLLSIVVSWFGVGKGTDTYTSIIVSE